jgi:hypothetical protein
VLYLFVPGKHNFSDPFYALMFPIAAGVIAIQYPFLNASKNWWFKILFFYLGMVLFLGILGLISGWSSPVGSSVSGGLSARADSVARTIIFGHFFGVWFLPVVVLVNWCLQKHRHGAPNKALQSTRSARWPHENR